MDLRLIKQKQKSNEIYIVRSSKRDKSQSNCRPVAPVRVISPMLQPAVGTLLLLYDLFVMGSFSVIGSFSILARLCCGDNFGYLELF